MFTGRTDAKAETPVLWPPHAKSWLIGKDPDAWRDLGQEEKGTTEDEMAGWHHRLNGHECEWTPGVGDGQGGLASCNSWGRKDLDTTERLNWTELETRLQEGMATHSSILAWRIPWTEELGGLQSLGSQRVGHNLATKQQLETAFMPILIGYLSYIRLFSFQSLSHELLKWLRQEVGLHHHRGGRKGNNSGHITIQPPEQRGPTETPTS